MRYLRSTLLLLGLLLAAQSASAQNHPDPETALLKMGPMDLDGSLWIQGPTLLTGGDRLEAFDLMELGRNQGRLLLPRTQSGQSFSLRKAASTHADTQ